MSLKGNGQTYSWGDVDVKIPGLVLVVQEISYDDEQDMEESYGKGDKRGWREVSDLDGVAFCQKLADAGVATVIYTDIGRDGALSGTNLDIYARLSGIAGLQVIASGGVSFETEIAALRDMGLYGCILGKALYAGKLRLERALAIARGEAQPC